MVKKERRLSGITTSIQHCTGVPSQQGKARKQSIRILKKETKLSFTDDILIYIENLKLFTDRLFELISYQFY